MVDLGYKNDTGGLCSPATDSADENKKSYPSTNLNRECLDKLGLDFKDVAMGEEFVLTARIKITSINSNQYASDEKPSGSVGFDVIEAELEGGSPKEKKQSEREEEVLGYKRNTGSEKKKMPSAKELEE